MPLYAYECQECGEKFELLVRSTSRQKAVTCPKCGTNKVRKAISLFGTLGASSDRASSVTSCGPGPV
jgi:putative FmdB family regulatory protein